MVRYRYHPSSHIRTLKVILTNYEQGSTNPLPITTRLSQAFFRKQHKSPQQRLPVFSQRAHGDLTRLPELPFVLGGAHRVGHVAG